MSDQRRRGRPPGLVADLTPSDSAELDADIRAGWMLRCWRLALAPESNARSFAATLTMLGRSADASRVSRWETGRLSAPFDVIAAYEEALDLPRGALVALAMLTRRLSQPRADLSEVLDPSHVDVDRYQHALDVAVDSRAAGGDWLDIASFAASHPEQAILPTSVWRQLAGRLVHELGLAVGAAYATRSQAGLLLSLHERARHAIVVAVGERVTENESRIVSDAISLLQPMADPRAGDLVIRLLGHPEEAARNAAIWAAAAKVSRGHFQGEQLAVLERAVIGLARRHGLDTGGLFGRLSDLVEVLPADVAERVRRAAPHLSAAAAPAAPPSAHPRSLVAGVARRVARPEGQPEEPMLERLVEEVLSHKVAERRFQAALSIALSPYRARVARGAARHLVEGVPGDPVLAERVVVLLTAVATEAEWETMRSFAEDPSSPHHLGALVALAHIPRSGVRTPVDLWPLRSPGEVPPETLSSAVY